MPNLPFHRRLWRFLLIGTLVAIAAFNPIVTSPRPARAAGITVNTSQVNSTTDGQCSLIEAILNAESDSQTSPDCPAGSGADTITLGLVGTFQNQIDYDLLTPYQDAATPNAVAFPHVTTPITILGSAYNNLAGSISANGSLSAMRFFHVEPTGSLTLRNMAVLYADLGEGQIGAIYNEGAVTLESVDLFGHRGNYATNSGSAFYNHGANGNTARATFINTHIGGSSFSQTFTGYGGAGGLTNIAEADSSALMTIRNSAVQGNQGYGFGAGLLNLARGVNASASIEVIDSGVFANQTFEPSVSTYGSGVANIVTSANAIASVSMLNVTLLTNIADNGGAVANLARCGAGAAACGSANVTIDSVSASYNRGYDTGTMIFSSRDTSPTATDKNRISVRNSYFVYAALDVRHCTLSDTEFTVSGVNVADDNTCPGMTTVPRTQLLLEDAVIRLFDSTYIPLSPDSILVDQIAPADCSTPADQRGVGRPVAGFCDIGAYELNNHYETVGVYNPVNSSFLLNTYLEERLPQFKFPFGDPGLNAIALSGDWNGDDVDTVGLYVPSTSVFLLIDTNASVPPDYGFPYGVPNSGMIPVVGDWDGDGDDTVGLYNPANGAWLLINTNASVAPDLSFVFTNPNTLPVVGDWNNDGIDTVGLHDTTTNDFYLRNSNSNGLPEPAFTLIGVGFGFVPVAGDYDGDGIDTIGLYIGEYRRFELRNVNTTGQAFMVTYGPYDLQGLIGRWRPDGGLPLNGGGAIVPSVAPTFAP